MSLNTIIDDLYDRVEDFCIDDILVESDVEMMGDDISLCEGDDDIEDSIDQLDESNLEYLLSDNDNNDDDSINMLLNNSKDGHAPNSVNNTKYVPPPMPLFTVGELGISSDDIKIVSGKKIRHVEHIPPDPTLMSTFPAPSSNSNNNINKNNNSICKKDHSINAKLFDPMCARKLGKWFMLRAKRELCLLNMFKQGAADSKDNYAYVSASEVYTLSLIHI